MKIFKSVLPFVLILFVKIFIDISYYGDRNLLYLVSNTLYTYLPYYIALIIAMVYLNKNKKFKRIILAFIVFVSIIMLLNSIPIYLLILFNISIDYLFNFTALSNVVFIGLACLVLINSILSKKTIAIVVSTLSLLVVIYTELVFIPGLDFNPYNEFITLFEHGLYKSMLRSFFTILFIWINVLLSFYGLLLSESNK
ncbi:hypothetical protein ACAG96_08810 [Candidatus Izemoplasma sp. B36]|uniref:hypothetical protein n=1 Tax=Candidatus Izemoplasma sp. B36 TaxID=3242468 RepID=UPI0035587695